jgi:hypothetical protein
MSLVADHFGEVFTVATVHKHFRDRLAGKKVKPLKPVSFKPPR